MERCLLFDSGCSLCTSIARKVEDASDGKLMARSLRDPEVRSILDEVKPGWRWEPMLLEVDGDRRRVYAGMGMRLRLVQVLGPRRALAMAQIVRTATVFQPGRRGVLRLAGGLLAGLTLGGWLSGNATAGDGPESGPTTRVFLPLIQGVTSSRVSLPPVDIQNTAKQVAYSTELAHKLRYRLPFDLVLLHPNHDNVAVVITSNQDLQGETVPSQLLVSYVDPTQKTLLLQVPIGILSLNDNIIAVIIPGKENEATFWLNKRGEILRHTVTPTTSAIGRKASLIASHFGLSDTGDQFVITGCNDSCVCSLVCGSIPVWYCPLIGYVSTPIGGILCSIVFLVTCSWICQ